MPAPDATVASLRPNPRNPRKVTDAKLAMLKKAMRKFGDLGGVVLNTTSGHLVGGHQRTKVLPSDATVHITKRYVQATSAGTVAEGHITWGGERFAYREMAWPPDLEKAANLAANKGAGEFDIPAVADWIGDLDTGDFDMDLTMFDADELAAIMAPSGNASDDDSTGEEEAPEPPAEPTSKLGDVWLLGKHRLMCGDSHNSHHVDTLVAADTVQMVYTDPPYGIRLDTDYSKVKSNNNYMTKTQVGNKWLPVIGDNEDYDPGFLLARFSGCKEIFLWGADYYCQHLPKEGSWIVWDKRIDKHGEPLYDFHGSYFELCWPKSKHQREICRWMWLGIKQKEHEGARVHPTQKPVGMAQWFFERWGKSGDVVVDLYGGSGSTLLACEKADRKCLMIEMNPGYCDVIVARWEKLTGQKATLAGDASNGMEKVGVDA